MNKLPGRLGTAAPHCSRQDSAANLWARDWAVLAEQTGSSNGGRSSLESHQLGIALGSSDPGTADVLGPWLSEKDGAGSKHLAETDSSLPTWKPLGSVCHLKAGVEGGARSGPEEESEVRGSQHVARIGMLGKRKTRGYPREPARVGYRLHNGPCSLPCSSLRNMQTTKFLCNLFEALHLSKQLSWPCMMVHWIWMGLSTSKPRFHYDSISRSEL